MGAARWATQPDQTTGYTRSANRSNSEKGSGGGMATPSSVMASWHPTVQSLLLLIVAELVAYGALRSFTKHGG